MTPVESDEEDLTRKQRREQARAQRKALEEAEAAGAARRKRLTQLGSVVAVVVVVIVVILIATGGGGGSSKPVVVGSKGATETQTAVTKLIGDIPQNGNTLGSPTAPLTLQYFGDLECPICKEFTLGALPTIIQKWVKTGKLRIEYHSLETATREPEVFKTQQVAAYAAGKQNKAWNFIETFYHEQGEEDSGYVTENYIQGIAKQVPGLNLTQWTSDRSDASLANEVTTDAQAANNAGFTGTPSFLLGKTGGKLSKYEPSSLTEPGPFDEEIEQLLKS
jgi:protein-disulfide isomerase